MGFVEAVKTCFSKYATFSGRARRSEFWWFYLFTLLASLVAAIIDRLIGWQTLSTNTWTVNGEPVEVTSYYNPGWIQVVVSLALILPMISVSVRRLHDRDASGWWWWLQLLNCLCGLGTIILVFAFWIRSGTPGPNKYGPDPKAVVAPGTA